MTSGVPQGSILGPLLFLVFINDLPNSALSSFIHLFADDTKCSKQVICWNDVSNLQEDLDRLYSWSMKWSLFFNDAKCISMSFSSSQPFINSSYHIAGNSVKQQNFHRDLGIILQENLKWDHHYDSISAKAYQKLGLIKRTFSTSNSISTKNQLYLSIVRSQLSYGDQLWRPMLIKHIVSLEKIQRRATKFIVGYNSNLSYKERLIQLNLLPLMYHLELYWMLYFL